MHNEAALVWINESEWNDLQLLACILILEVKLMCLEGLIHMFLYHEESNLDIFCHMRTKVTKHKEKMEDYSWAEPSAERPLFTHRRFKVGMQNCYNVIKIKTKSSLERAWKTKKFNWWSQYHLPSFQYNTQAEGGGTKFESH